MSCPLLTAHFIPGIILDALFQMDILMDDHLFGASLMDLNKNRKRRHSDTEFSDDDASSPKSHSPSIDDDRRAHHNELERRRRDHIKDHFMALKETIPLLEGEKSSRALILKRAIEYISMMQSKLRENQTGIAELKRRNEMLEAKLSDQRNVSVSPVAVAPVARYVAIPSSSAHTVPINPIQIQTFKPQPPIQQIQTAPVSAALPSLPSLDSLRLSGLLPPSADNMLALAQMLLNQSKFNAAPRHEVPISVPDLHTRLLANSLVLRDRQLSAAVQF